MTGVLCSVAFILVAIFLAFMREKSHERPQKVAQVADCFHSEHHAVFIGCQHERCSHYCLGHGTEAMLFLENVPVLFAAYPVCGLPNYNLSGTAENN